MERLGGLIHRLPVTSALLPGRRRRHLGPAAAQRLRLRMAAVPGRPREHGLPLGFLRFLAPAVGALMALAAALAAACFVRAYGIAFLGRPAARPPGRARDRAPAQLARWSSPPLLCFLLGIFPGPVIDLIGGGGRDRRRRACPSRPPGLAVAGAGRARRQQLQRPGPARVHRASPASPSAFFVHRFASDRAAARPGLGLRLSRPAAAHAVHGLELRPAAAAGVRRLRLPRPRGGRHARRRARRGRRVFRLPGATSSGSGSTRRSAVRLGA